MLEKPLETIDAADIQGLVDAGVREGVSLDFKWLLPTKSDKDRIDLCADASAFANTTGGYLVFGLKEEAGLAVDACGVGDCNVDAEMIRIAQTIGSGISPRIPGVLPGAVRMPSGAVVIVVRIPKSWRGPHLVKNGDNFRMYVRQSNANALLDADQIRAAYEAASEVGERLRSWRRERVEAIQRGEGVIPLHHYRLLIVHLIPLEAVSGVARHAMESLKEHRGRLVPVLARGEENRINLDGLLTFDRAWGTGYHSYCQTFRSGIIESVSEPPITHAGDTAIMRSWELEGNTIHAVQGYLSALKALGVNPPVVVMCTLTRCEGLKLAVKHTRMEYVPQLFDRSLMTFPEVLVEDLDADTGSMLRPLFDGIWNAAGYLRCFNYDENGRWREER